MLTRIKLVLLLWLCWTCTGALWTLRSGGASIEMLSRDCDTSDQAPCSGHGACSERGLCTCATGYAGSRCQAECPGGASSPCSGHGECVTALLGRCRCASGWRGRDCSEVDTTVQSVPTGLPNTRVQSIDAADENQRGRAASAAAAPRTARSKVFREMCAPAWLGLPVVVGKERATLVVQRQYAPRGRRTGQCTARVRVSVPAWYAVSCRHQHPLALSVESRRQSRDGVWSEWTSHPIFTSHRMSGFAERNGPVPTGLDLASRTILADVAGLPDGNVAQLRVRIHVSPGDMSPTVSQRCLSHLTSIYSDETSFTSRC